MREYMEKLQAKGELLEVRREVAKARDQFKADTEARGGPGLSSR